MLHHNYCVPVNVQSEIVNRKSFDSPIEFYVHTHASCPKALRNRQFALKWAVKECVLLSLIPKVGYLL